MRRKEGIREIIISKVTNLRPTYFILNFDIKLIIKVTEGKLCVCSDKALFGYIQKGSLANKAPLYVVSVRVSICLLI